jgi:hypothetical protein
MNNEFIVPARRHWVEAGWHPPQSEAYPIVKTKMSEN